MRRRGRGARHRCSVTTKIRYRDEAEAKAALRTIQAKGEQREQTPNRVYECEFCNGWHMTHKQITVAWGPIDYSQSKYPTPGSARSKRGRSKD